MIVETKTVNLETLSVTIQALHVNGKQMTLSVFRQLPRASIYNDDGSLAPMECWGIVRYTIKNEGDLWVVASSGGRLYRCELWHYQKIKNARDRWELACAVQSWLDRQDPSFFELTSYDREVMRENRYDSCENGRVATVWDKFYDRSSLSLKELNKDNIDVECNKAEYCFYRVMQYEATYNSLLRLPQLFIAV